MNRAGSMVRFLVVAFMLLGTALFLDAHKHREQQLPPRAALTSFPTQVAGGVGHDVPLDPSILEILGPGEFLSRIYAHPKNPPVDLFIGYFPSQRTGNSIHSPKNCLPGSGWTTVDSSQIQIAASDRPPITINRYIIARGLDRAVVLYWYQAHNRIVASEYWAKIYLVSDAITLNRTDGALVRIVTPIRDGESRDAAEARAVVFAEQIIPALAQYIPS